MNLLVKNDDVCRDGVCNDVVVDLILLFSTATISSSSASHRLLWTFSRNAVLGTLLILLHRKFVARPTCTRSAHSIGFLQQRKKKKHQQQNLMKRWGEIEKKITYRTNRGCEPIKLSQRIALNWRNKNRTTWKFYFDNIVRLQPPPPQSLVLHEKLEHLLLFTFCLVSFRSLRCTGYAFSQFFFLARFLFRVQQISGQ